MEEERPEKVDAEGLLMDIRCHLKIICFVIRHVGDLPPDDKIDILRGIERMAAGVAGKINLIEKKS